MNFSLFLCIAVALFKHKRDLEIFSIIFFIAHSTTWCHTFHHPPVFGIFIYALLSVRESTFRNQRKSAVKLRFHSATRGRESNREESFCDNINI